MSQSGAAVQFCARNIDKDAKAADDLERIQSGALARRFGWLSDHVKGDMPPAVRERVVQVAKKSRKTWLGPDPASAQIAPVPNDLIQVNPLGLAITYFREDEAFK
jgi:hypothetical protein